MRSRRSVGPRQRLAAPSRVLPFAPVAAERRAKPVIARSGREHPRLVIPLGAAVAVELEFRGSRVTAEHVRTLRAHLEIMERTIDHETAHGEIETESIDPVVVGDLVQIRPSADPIFGGLVMRVTKARGNEVKGYLLVPHRGGHAEMWQTYTHAEVVRIGRVKFPEAEFGFSKEASEQRRRMWIE